MTFLWKKPSEKQWPAFERLVLPLAFVVLAVGFLAPQGARAAVAFVNSATANPGSVSSFTVPVSWTNGNTGILYVMIANSAVHVNASGVSDNGSSVWLEHTAVNGTTGRIEMWSTTAGGIAGSPTTITVQLGGTSKVVGIAGQYSGVNSVGMLRDSTGTDTAPTNTGRIRDANDFIVMGVAASGTGTFSASVGTLRTSVVSSGGSDVGGALNDNTAAGASSNITNTVTLSASEDWTASAWELRAASDPAPSGQFLQGANCNYGASTGNTVYQLTLNKPYTVGALFVLVVHINDITTTVTVTQAGHTWASAIGPVTLLAGTTRIQIFYSADSNANPAPVIVTLSAIQGGELTLHEYTGIVASPLDQTSNASGTSTALDSGSKTITSPNELIFGFGFPTSGTLTAGTNLTARFTNAPGLSEDRVVTATGSYSASETLSPSGQWDMFMATFKLAPGGTQAVTSRSDILSDSRPSATSNHTFTFTINNSLDTTGWGAGSGGDATDTLAITFASSFSLSNIFCKDVDISFGGVATSIAGYFQNRATSKDCPGSATSWGLFIDPTASTITFYTPTSLATYVATGTQVQVRIGTNTSFQEAGTAWVTNPASAGTYTMTVGGTFGGGGNILVAVLSGLTVQAYVAESLSITVSSVAAVNCTADDGASITAVATAPTSVPFGTVSANTFYIGCQDLIVATNAGGGYTLTTQEQTLLHTAGGSTIPDTTCDGGTCSESVAAAWTNATKNGYGHTCFNQVNHDCDSSYSNGTNFRQFANIAFGETAQNIMASSTPVVTATGRMKHRLSVRSSQAAGTYTAILTYIITATF